MQNFENIFRNSNNNDELFDAFQDAVNRKIDDIELYKILLGNPVLTEDEVIMYANKLAKEFKEKEFEIYLWTGSLFETCNLKTDYTETAFQYYKKAASVSPDNSAPYIQALNLYNYELKTQLNDQIIQFTESTLSLVTRKENLCKALSNHYKKIGNTALQKKYHLLALKASKEE